MNSGGFLFPVLFLASRKMTLRLFARCVEEIRITGINMEVENG